MPKIEVHAKKDVMPQDWPVLVDGVVQNGAKITGVEMPVEDVDGPHGSTYRPTGQNTATVVIPGIGTVKKVPIRP